MMNVKLRYSIGDTVWFKLCGKPHKGVVQSAEVFVCMVGGKLVAHARYSIGKTRDLNFQVVRLGAELFPSKEALVLGIKEGGQIG